MKNAVNREIPANLPGYGPLKPYLGPFATQPNGTTATKRLRVTKPGTNKVLGSLEEAIEAAGLKDGMTISFHHSLRNGDYVINMVVAVIAKMGIKGLTLAPSSFLDTNDALIPYIEQGVIDCVQTSGARGKLGRTLTFRDMVKPTIIRTHGGRARALESGELKVDVTFIAAPTCDIYGNINGVQGPAACGSMGYAMSDARYADTVVAVTDNLVQGPICPISVPMTNVDYIVAVDCIGDPKGIASGSLRYTTNPRELRIAQYTAKVMEYSGYFKEGFAMQLGAGAASLAAGRYLREAMVRDKICANLAVGGVSAPFVELLDEGLIKTILDVQDFDIGAINSLRTNPNHQEMDASFYANPHNGGPAVNLLDFVVLAATEVDVNFNVNVITDSNGVIMGASGGHADTAAGANLTIITAPLLRGRLPMVTDNVQTVVTPGETVDVVVTERGVAVNPLRQDLMENLKHAGLPLVSIHDLKKMAYDLVGEPDPIQLSDEIVAVVEYRDGTVTDVIRRPIV